MNAWALITKKNQQKEKNSLTRIRTKDDSFKVNRDNHFTIREHLRHVTVLTYTITENLPIHFNEVVSTLVRSSKYCIPVPAAKRSKVEPGPCGKEDKGIGPARRSERKQAQDRRQGTYDPSALSY